MYEHVHGPVQNHSSYSEKVPGGGKMGEQPGQGEELEMLVVGAPVIGPPPCAGLLFLGERDAA